MDRTLALLGTVVVASLSLLASCGGDGKLELTLISRMEPTSSDLSCVDERPEIYEQCLEVGPQQFVAVDGRRATVPARSTVRSWESRESAEVVCAGTDFGYKSRATSDSPQELVLEFDDGSTLTMREESAMVVPASFVFLCFEARGRWQGTAGDMSGRTGTFEWFYDTIQTTLHLDED